MIQRTSANPVQDMLSSLSPTGQILLHCAAFQLGLPAIEQVKALVPQIQDWEHLFSQAQTHKVLPQLYQVIQQIEPSLIEPVFLAKLKCYYSHWQKRSLLCTYEMVRIVEQLAEKKIPSIVFKGPTLAQIAYGKPEYRSFTDLDFWVSKADYIRVQAILSEKNYLPWKPLEKSAIEQKKFQLYAGEYTLFREQGKIFLDIHYRCLGAMNIAFSADFSMLWQRLETVSIAGKTVQTFSCPDLLIYLCLNGTKDGWPCLRHALDIAALIQNTPAMDWIRVKQYAAELNVEKIVMLSLMLTELVTGVGPPPNCDFQIDHFHLRPLANHLAHKLIQSLDKGSSLSLKDEVWMRWRICADSTERFRYCLSPPKRMLKLMFAVNSIDKQFLSLPKYLSFLYYILRPIRVIQRYRRDIFKVLIK